MVMRFFRAAYHGSYEYLMQRFTAVIMAVYTLLLGGLLLVARPADFTAWQGVFAPLWFRIATLLCLFSLFIHAWQGVGDILNDYVKPLVVRKTLRLATTLALVFYVVWSVNILWKL